MLNRQIIRFFSAFWLILISSPPAKACNIALALTVDVSGSVNSEEYALQMNGLAAALRDPTVADALVKEKASVMLVQWSGTSRQKVVLRWRHIITREHVDELANRVESIPRVWRNFSTAIGDALIFTASHFEEVPQCKRKVIDVSGDGYSNEGVDPFLIRREMASRGFTVNGLAIEGSVEKLTQYYLTDVIAGPGAFAMTANNFEEYPKRIRQKLLREVSKQIVLLD